MCGLETHPVHGNHDSLPVFALKQVEVELQADQISEDTHDSWEQICCSTHTYTHCDVYWELRSYWDLSSPDDLVPSVSVLSVPLAVGFLVAEESQRLRAFQLDLKLLQETGVSRCPVCHAVPCVTLSRAQPSQQQPVSGCLETGWTVLTSFHLGSDVYR